MVQFLEQEGDSREEKAIDVKSLRGAARAYSAKLAEMKEEARREFKTICDRCVKRDYEQGRLKPDWKAYASQLRHVKTHDARNPKTQKFLGIQMDFVCQSGHGVCMSITGDEYNVYMETNGVAEIIEKRPGTSRADALKAYRVNNGDVVLAIGSLEAGSPSKPSAVQAPKPVEVVKDADGKG